MAWYLNHYHCGDCGTDWDDEWSCCCDDDCPTCGSRHWSPVDSDDLTFIIEPDEGQFAVYVSPATAEHTPNYELAAVATDLSAATAYVNQSVVAYWSAPRATSK